MRTDISSVFSNFSHFKSNCHPANPKYKRRQPYGFRRQKNQSVLEGEQLQLSYALAINQKDRLSSFTENFNKVISQNRVFHEFNHSDSLNQEFTMNKTKILVNDVSQSKINRPRSDKLRCFDRKDRPSPISAGMSVDQRTNSQRKIFQARKQMLMEKFKKRKNHDSKQDSKTTEVLRITRISESQAPLNSIFFLKQSRTEGNQKPKRIKSAITRIDYSSKKELSKQSKNISKKSIISNQIHHNNSAVDFSKRPSAQGFFQEECSQLDVRFYTPNTQRLLKIEQFQDFGAKANFFGKAFTVAHSKNGQWSILHQKNANTRMEFASLTKVMTCLLILLLSQKFKIDINSAQVLVSLKASQLKGTSAFLLSSDVLTVYDLLHGLMLPSGNDAALALAEWGGKTIRKMCMRKTLSPSPRMKKVSRISPVISKSPVSLFIYHMNTVAKVLGMTNTKFANPHGLMNLKNYSCSQDLIRLCMHASSRKDFQQIASKKLYSCRIFSRKYASFRDTIWTNTNKLLQINGFTGTKTGITPTAGPCLASCYEVSSNQKIFIVLLNTLSAAHRFEESKNILAETLRQLHFKTGSKQYLVKLNLLNLEKVQINQGETLEDSNDFAPQQDEFDEI